MNVPEFAYYNSRGSMTDPSTCLLLVAKHRMLYKLEKHGWKLLIQHYARGMHMY